MKYGGRKSRIRERESQLKSKGTFYVYVSSLLLTSAKWEWQLEKLCLLTIYVYLNVFNNISLQLAAMLLIISLLLARSRWISLALFKTATIRRVLSSGRCACLAISLSPSRDRLLYVCVLRSSLKVHPNISKMCICCAFIAESWLSYVLWYLPADCIAFQVNQLNGLGWCRRRRRRCRCSIYLDVDLQRAT